MISEFEGIVHLEKPGMGGRGFGEESFQAPAPHSFRNKLTATKEESEEAIPINIEKKRGIRSNQSASVWKVPLALFKV